MAEIQLTQGKVALVDDEDAPLLEGLVWSAHKSNDTYYAASKTQGERRRRISMHRFILQPEAHLVVDHINGNGLDNRRANLRCGTQAQNSFNRKWRLGASGVKGVAQNKSGTFYAWICRNRRAIRLGTFKTVEEAAAARRAWEIREYGDFALRNQMTTTDPAPKGVGAETAPAPAPGLESGEPSTPPALTSTVPSPTPKKKKNTDSYRPYGMTGPKRPRYANWRNLPPLELDLKGDPTMPTLGSGVRLHQLTEDERKARFLLWFNWSCGNITMACVRSGMVPAIYHRWMTDPEFQDAIARCKEEIADRAAFKLMVVAGLVPGGDGKPDRTVLSNLLKALRPDMLSTAPFDERGTETVATSSAIPRAERKAS